MSTLVSTILQLFLAGIQVAPELIQAAITEYDLLTSGTAPTAAQEATISAALTTANTALQASQPATTTGAAP